jgi:hypothetical protein
MAAGRADRRMNRYSTSIAAPAIAAAIYSRLGAQKPSGFPATACRMRQYQRYGRGLI